MNNSPASEELQCFGTILKRKSTGSYIGRGPEGIMFTLRAIPPHGWKACLRASTLQLRYYAEGATREEALALLEKMVALRTTRAKAQRECLESLSTTYLDSNTP